MGRILFISPSKMKAQSVVEENVDDKVLSNVILQVQESQLEPVLGKALYKIVEDFLVEKVADNTFTIPEPTNELLLDYIQPFLVYAAVADFIAINNYKISNKGTQKLNDNSSTAVSSTENEYIKNYYDNLASTYKNRLLVFLEENTLLEHDADTNITLPLTGWFFDNGSRTATTTGSSSSPSDELELDPVWIANKANFYTKGQVDALLNGGIDGAIDGLIVDTSLSTISELTAYTGNVEVISVTDLQGGTFISSEDDLVVDNGTIFPKVGGGFWVRQLPISSTVTPQMFGAKGNGTYDDTTAIQKAADYITSIGGGTVYLPTGTYKIRRSIWLSSNTELKGAGISATIITKGNSVRSVITANASTEATSVNVVDASAFNVGDSFHAADTSNFEWASTQGVITAISSNTITFDNPLDANLLTTRAAYVSTSFPLLRNIQGSKNILVSNLTLDQNANAADPADEFTISTIHWVETYDSVVEGVEILNSASDAYSDQAQEGIGLVPAANLIKTTKNHFRNNVINTSGRHGVHLGTCMNGAFVIGNRITDCVNMALFYCAYVTNTVASNNLVENCGKGFAGGDERDTNNIIDGNIFKDCGSLGWTIEVGGNTIITGNNLKNCARGILIAHPNCTLSNNYVEMTSGAEAIRITTLADKTTITGGYITGGLTPAVGSTGLYIDSADDVKISNLTITGFYKGADLRSVQRLKVDNSPIHNITIGQGWIFNVAASTDISIDLNGTTVSSPVVESVVPVRAIYNGVGTNGSTNPSVSGNWLLTAATAANKKYDGTIVQWNDGIEHYSIFKQGIGWNEIALPQGLKTTDSPTFAGVTIPGKIVVNSSTVNTWDTSNNSVIYASNLAGGTTYPFLINGALVLQARAGRDIVLTTSNDGVNRMVLTNNGKVGIGAFGDSGSGAALGAPMAWLHIKAGTTQVGQAPLKFNVGVLNSVAEAGAVEVDANHIYYTNNAGTRMQLDTANGFSTLTGNVGIGTPSPSARLDVVGTVKSTQYLLSALNTAPASATATGTTGEIRITAGFVYVCIATNTWVRNALTTW